jgi:hypothetical protein
MTAMIPYGHKDISDIGIQTAADRLSQDFLFKQYLFTPEFEEIVFL